MGDVWSGIADVAIHLSHHANMLITVEERVFVVLHAVAAAMRCLVRLEACIGQDDNQALGILVVAWDGHMLLGDQLREAGRRK